MILGKIEVNNSLKFANNNFNPRLKLSKNLCFSDDSRGIGVN